MIVVRFVFQTKWGQIQQVVDEFKKYNEPMKRVLGPDVKIRVLTDLSGPFHTLVQEFEVESLAEWERARAEMFSMPEMQDSGGGENPFESGSLEFYTLEYSS